MVFSKDYIILYIEKYHLQIQKALLQLMPIGLLVIIENQIGNMSIETCEKNYYLTIKKTCEINYKTCVKYHLFKLKILVQQESYRALRVPVQNQCRLQ
jgi:hypothetical protein